MKNGALLVISLLVSVLFLEVLLRLFTPFPVSLHSNKIPDEDLVYGIDSDFPGIDVHGFRNDSGPDGTKIFAIGDSHTYGFNVEFENSWPRKLENSTGKKTYNLGIGSYNIYQYYVLFDKFVTYEPESIIIALYPSNDLFVGPCAALGVKYWKTKSVELDLEISHCINSRGDWKYDYSGPIEKINSSRTSATLDASRKLVIRPLKSVLRRLLGIDGWYFSVGTGFDRMMVNKYRVSRLTASTDTDNPVIQGHYLNSIKLFRAMKRMAEENDVGLYVLIVPSKTRVVARWARDNGFEAPSPVEDAGAQEDRLATAYAKAFTDLSIPYADAIDGMARLLGKDFDKGIRTHPDGNGHPYEGGYEVYAATARGMLLEAGASPSH